MSENVDNLYQTALVRLDRWELDEAEQLLRQLLNEDPQHAAAVNKLGVIYARRNQFNQAEDYFQRALSIDADLASAYSNLGNIYLQREQLQQAEAAYQRAIQCDPEYAIAYHNLGVVYRKMGRLSESVDMLKKGTRMERANARQELASSPEKKRAVNMIWLVVAAAILFFLLRR